MPYAVRTEKPAEEKGRRDHKQDISEAGDHKGRYAFSKPLQSAGGGDRDGGKDETDADDLKRPAAFVDRFRIGGEQSDQRRGKYQTEQRPAGHDQTAHDQYDGIDLPDASIFTGSIIKTNKWTHTLDETIGRQIKEGLEFIIYAQDNDIDLGKGG